MPSHGADAAQPRRRPQLSDAINQTVDEKASDQFDEDFD
jgi:hypothetical protein